MQEIEISMQEVQGKSKKGLILAEALSPKFSKSYAIAWTGDFVDQL